MKKQFYRFTKASLCLALALTLSQCKKSGVSDAGLSAASAVKKTFNTTAALAGPGGGVLMQAFYWNTPNATSWWTNVNSKIASWDAAGISAIWLPPATKGQSGGSSMGYDPYDYFDFGTYNQMGSVTTRFGNLTDLNTLISNAHSHNIQVYADMVLNHCSGGTSEANPYTGTSTYTKFTPLSGKFNRSYSDFHPNNVHASDEGSFGGFPDLCHAQANVSNWVYNASYSMSRYYKNTMHYDGWRFDYVKGFGAWVVQNYVNSVGGFAVGENWDGNAANLQNWVNATGGTSSAFDFACFYAMHTAFDSNDLTHLNDDMMLKRNAAKAVTFVSNHDTDIIGNKYSAYAYIMTHEGYPCVFYNDYETWLDKNRMNNLIWIHRTLAGGTTTNLWSASDQYIDRRNGYGAAPGVIVYFNGTANWQQQWVTSNWANKQIKEYTGASGWVQTVAADGRVLIQAPPHAYSIWSVTGY
ncbi:MAG: Alpha-amylase precursor [Mucilaginibacter sp.]|nr:Alpha-amylase precursor [Mucilaginibacter sp.]